MENSNIKKSPVSLCIICKNDEESIEDCLKSFRPYVDEICVVDTGSTDSTLEIAKRYADKYIQYTGCNDENGLIKSFADARNKSLELASNKCVIWADADDVVIGLENLNDILEEYKAAADSVDCVALMFKYEYAYSQNGVCTLEHFRERLFTNKDAIRSEGPVHEVFVQKENKKVLFKLSNRIVWKHRRQYLKKKPEPGRNLRILERHIQEVGDSDPRQLYYIGKEYVNARQYDNAVKYLTRYIGLSQWDDEKCMAALDLARACEMSGNYEEGIKWGFKAIEIKENWSEGYLVLSKMFYFLAKRGGIDQKRNWERCVHFGKLGLDLPPTKTLLFINPYDREYFAHLYLNVALNNLGRVSEALDSVNQGLRKVPNDAMLLHNKTLYEKFLARQSFNLKLNEMVSQDLIDVSAQARINKIIDAYKSTDDSKDGNLNFLNSDNLSNKPVVEGDKFIKNLHTHFEIDRKPACARPLDIVFFIGDGLEEWTPESVKKNGIGGSETAAIEMSKNLAVLGHRVRVFSGCGPRGEGIYDGVEYLRTEKFKNLQCDILIVSRLANMLDDAYDIHAKVKLLWCHDVIAVNANDKLLQNADHILALSSWHKKYLCDAHNLHSDRVLVTRNGINLERFNKKIDRNRHKVVNSSCPFRSWSVLLDCWPRIKARVPEAELHLFYGFRNGEALARHDPIQMKTIEALKEKIAKHSSYGVIFRDRLPQDKLAEEFLSAGVIAYPTAWLETSCITMMEAQAAGLRPITSSLAAINETVGDRGVLIDGDCNSPEYQEKFIDEVVSALQREDDSDREDLKRYARENFEWCTLSVEWQNMFYNFIDNKYK